MGLELLEQAAGLLERANALVAAAELTGEQAAAWLHRYARVERLASFGKAALSAGVGDPVRVAGVVGTSVGRARQTVGTGRGLRAAPKVARALREASISFDQAEEIVRTVQVSPGCSDRLLEVARTGTFHALKQEAHRVRLEANRGSGLAARQHEARSLSHRVTELGMVHIEAELEPHIGAPLVSRLQDHAGSLARAARRAGQPEPFHRHLADALPLLLDSSAGTRRARPELVILVSHEITQRGWDKVRDGEHCKIPGVGPIDPQLARRIGGDAFLTALLYDGTDLRHFKRWTRSIPAPIRLALQLGDPPGFDGPRCIDCGNHFALEIDHLHPFSTGGETSVGNLGPRCPPCHRRKTRLDMAGRAPP